MNEKVVRVLAHTGLVLVFVFFILAVLGSFLWMEYKPIVDLVMSSLLAILFAFLLVDDIIRKKKSNIVPTVLAIIIFLLNVGLAIYELVVRK